jgi:hypothetical protein
VAEVVNRVEFHDCREEITADGLDDLYIGSVVQCSCGQRYVRRSDQRDGLYWAEVRENYR